MRQIKNNTGSRAVVHFTATETVVLVGNTSTSAICEAGETINGATVTSASWGTSNGASWTISRGANVVAVFNNSGDTMFGSSTLTLDPTANLTVTLAGGTGHLILDIRKMATVANSQYLVQ